VSYNEGHVYGKFPKNLGLAHKSITVRSVSRDFEGERERDGEMSIYFW
jgi:hypothetical protein